jgi:hypothetical protein
MGTDEDVWKNRKMIKEMGTYLLKQRFGWYTILNRLSDDITKHDIILEKTLVEALNQMVYIIAKDKEQEKRHKEMMMQIRS